MSNGQDEVHESGQVEATEILHGDNPTDLHFRYIGTAKGRQFIVNVQFDSHDGKTGERLNPNTLSWWSRCLAWLWNVSQASPASGCISSVRKPYRYFSPGTARRFVRFSIVAR